MRYLSAIFVASVMINPVLAQEKQWPHQEYKNAFDFVVDTESFKGKELTIRCLLRRASVIGASLNAACPVYNNNNETVAMLHVNLSKIPPDKKAYVLNSCASDEFKDACRLSIKGDISNSGDFIAKIVEVVPPLKTKD